jgi:ABC-type branched-subunit amino acid transport system substrate-binding protein
MNYVTTTRDFDALIRGGQLKLGRLAGGLALSLLLAAAPVAAQETSLSGTGGATGVQIKQVLGLDGKDAKALGTGLHFKLGIVLALTGPGSYYGRIQSNGARLAVAQIKAAGGPDIELIFKDHKTADPRAGH